MTNKINSFPFDVSCLHERSKDGTRIIRFLPLFIVTKEEVENATSIETRLVKERGEIKEEHGANQNQDWASPVHESFTAIFKHCRAVIVVRIERSKQRKEEITEASRRAAVPYSVERLFVEQWQSESQ